MSSACGLTAMGTHVCRVFAFSLQCGHTCACVLTAVWTHVCLVLVFSLQWGHMCIESSRYHCSVDTRV